jgi:CDK-activating kinase assembly factor MAT1
VAIRQRELASFNLTLEDFNGDLDKYNNFLEEREDIAFNLIHHAEVEATKARIAAFLAEHDEKIRRNRDRAEKARRERMEKRRLEKEAEKEARRKAELRQAQERQQILEV